MQEEIVSNVHNCELKLRSDLTFSSFRPPFVRSSRWLEKFKLWCLMSEYHPKSEKWVDSLAAVRRERRRQCHLPQWWIVHPFSSVRFAWEILMTLVYAIAFLSIPFMISFVVLDYELVRLDNLNPIIYLFFWLDILFNCFTGVPSNRDMTISLRQADIFKSYLRGFFLIDILTALPYDRITYEWRKIPGRDSSIIVAMINLIPLLKISRYVTFHSYVSQLFVIKDFAYQMFSTLLLSFYIIHWFACVCYVTPIFIMYILRITIEECEDCWVNKIANKEISSRYRHALFIVIQNFVGSGFGGIEPKTQGYTIVCTVLMYLGRLFEAYIVIMFLQIRAANKTAESKYQEIINQLMAYTRQKQLPPYMKRRLLAYYHYRFRNTYFREKRILADLSRQLRQEILLHSCRSLVEDVAVLKNLPKDVLVSIVSNLRFEIYLPNDVIVKAGTQGDCMFFLANGTVAVLTPTGKEVCHLEDGAHFGEVALLVQDQRRVANVLAIEVCEVYRLDRQNFRKCIAVHSDLFEKIDRLATDRMKRTSMIEDQYKRFLMNTSRAISSFRRSREHSTK